MQLVSKSTSNHVTDEQDAQLEPVHVVDERVPLGDVQASVLRQESRGVEILSTKKRLVINESQDLVECTVEID